MRTPVKPSGRRWPARLRRQRWFPWMGDPRVVLDPDPDLDDFSAAMAAFHVGATFKITARGRHAVSNAILREHVDLAGATILDIGASDGGTSVDLIEELGDTFARYFITDRHLDVEAARVWGHVVFFETSGEAILVAGPGYVAYPADSAIVAAVWRPLIGRARRHPSRRPLQLVHPDARAVAARDPRVTICEHDLFEPWTGPVPDLIKVANLLNSAYFSDEQLRSAIALLASTVRDGGHVLVIDNPVDPLDLTACTGLYRRAGDSLVEVDTGAPRPAVAALLGEMAEAGMSPESAHDTDR